ncbi:MAG: chorismate-binding protein [Prolixibacteraceae bacterium]|nr:chorismate-binding protein [Prolixibacteraceae bacterium]
MKPVKIKVTTKTILADVLTPVSVYLKFRNIYKKSILLESSDYHGKENACSYICLKPMYCLKVSEGKVILNQPGNKNSEVEIEGHHELANILNDFYHSFKLSGDNNKTAANGLFGYLSYDSIKYFEKLDIKSEKKEEYDIPEVCYCLYKYVIAIDHTRDLITLIENLPDEENSEMEKIESLLNNLTFQKTNFKTEGEEKSNMTDEDYLYMVKKGKQHCFRGDVFQVVLSRQFSQKFKGDEFNVYRALRSVNPSPYLFYFDYGDYRLFGSSPESTVRIQKGRVISNPIAGTFRRTGDDEKDRELARKLCKDPKEKAEHTMLVDLARNDVSRNAEGVRVDDFMGVQYFSHVLHLVSEVSGKLPDNYNMMKVLGDCFPAGTLSGAPKLRAMQLIDQYENQCRGFYAGTIGFIGFNDTLNHAIMIRSFLSKGGTLYYQAGAGIVAASVEENELQEVNNKLAALKEALENANKME